MSDPQAAAAKPSAPDEVQVAESRLGQVLALIHRALARLDEPERAEAVQGALSRAVGELEAARAAHARAMTALGAGPVEPEIVALIAAAVATVLNRPHRILGVQPTAPAVAWVNAWAIEGRFQHYSSHRVR